MLTRTYRQTCFAIRLTATITGSTTTATVLSMTVSVSTRLITMPIRWTITIMEPMSRESLGQLASNGAGVVGINWNIKIMPCKFANANGSGTIADAIDCLDYVKTMKDRGFNIIATSNSWGGGGFCKPYLMLSTRNDNGECFSSQRRGMVIFSGSVKTTTILPSILAITISPTLSALPLRRERMLALRFQTSGGKRYMWGLLEVRY